MRKLVLCCLLAISAVTGCGTKEKETGKDVFPPNREELYQRIWKNEEGFQKMPDAVLARVLFFDLDGDGQLDALVGYGIKNYFDSLTYKWVAYHFEDGKWQYRRDERDGNVVGFTTFHGPEQYNDFYVLSKKGKRTRLVKAGDNFGVDNFGLGSTRITQQVTVNDNGNLRLYPLPGLIDDGKYYTDWCVKDVLENELDPTPYKLEPIPVEKFHLLQRKDYVQDTDAEARPAFLVNASYTGRMFSEGNFTKDMPVVTREDILKVNPPDPDWSNYNNSRLYAEIDLTDSGLPDIIISDDLQMGGTGGVGWSVFLCISTNQYRELDIGLGGRTFALEKNEKLGKRLWMYWHSSCNTGSMQCLYLDTDGEWKLSNSIEVHRIDSGSDAGWDYFEEIFKDENNSIEMKWLSPD